MNSLIKRTTILICAAGFICFSVKAQSPSEEEMETKVQMPDSVKVVLDSSIALLQQFSLNSKTLNWAFVKQEAYKKAAMAKTWNELAPAVDYLFKSVKDHHGWLSVGDTDLRWNTNTTLKFSEAVKTEISKGNKIVKRILPGNVGYLRVPGMMLDTSMYNNMAQRLADSLYALEQQGAKQIIIDLRLNAGGTIFPMIAGVSALLGNGEFMGGKEYNGTIKMNPLENGKFDSDEGGVAAAINHCSVLNSSTKVAVLTSNLTGSAGECTAVTFIGRSNTRFIGEPTAGYTTGNNGHWIIEGKAGIVIAESLLVDRNRKVYADDIQPDELIWGGDNFDDYLKDKKIIAAMKWFKE